MAEAADKDSKTEEATEKKIRDSVEKGNTPFSREAPILASVLAFLSIVSFSATSGGIKMASLLAQFMDRPEDWTINNGQDAEQLFRILAVRLAVVLLPVFIVLPLAGVLASLLQNAPNIVLERIRPQFSRISPAQGFKRVFGLQGQVEFLKALFKFTAISTIVLLVLMRNDDVFLRALTTEAVAIPELIREIIGRLLGSAAVALTALAGFDLVWSRFNWRRDLKMSRQEVKDEMKQMEGDPLVKARLRSLGRDRARRRMIEAVPSATLVVANPTHFSVALRYRPETDAAPVVVAKGQDLIALKIREMAEAHEIPIFENVALARALYKQVEVDNLIPQEFYKAVAELVQYVYAKKQAPRNAVVNRSIQ